MKYWGHSASSGERKYEREGPAPPYRFPSNLSLDFGGSLLPAMDSSQQANQTAANHTVNTVNNITVVRLHLQEKQELRYVC